MIGACLTIMNVSLIFARQTVFIAARNFELFRSTSDSKAENEFTHWHMTLTCDLMRGHAIPNDVIATAIIFSVLRDRWFGKISMISNSQQRTATRNIQRKRIVPDASSRWRTGRITSNHNIIQQSVCSVLTHAGHNHNPIIHPIIEIVFGLKFSIFENANSRKRTRTAATIGRQKCSSIQLAWHALKRNEPTFKIVYFTTTTKANQRNKE